MFRKSIILIFAGFMLSQLEASVSLPESLYPLIDQELARAKVDLDNNTISSAEEINNLKAGLDEIWSNIKNKGYSEATGTDSSLRPAYVTMQGIIESTITKGLVQNKIGDAIAYIITPRMPTPLILKSGSSLSAINFKDPIGFAMYRNPILLEFLKAGGIINAYYSHDAKSVLAAQSLDLDHYNSYCDNYDNLIDRPVINIATSKFPVEVTGAVYMVDGFSITIEARQVTQIDDENRQSWAIKFGKDAELRKNEIAKFLQGSSFMPLDEDDILFRALL